ncbi:MAG: PAS domain S-box protein [Terriglobales bacterium]
MREKEAIAAGSGNLPQIEVRPKVVASETPGKPGSTAAPSLSAAQENPGAVTVEQAYFHQLIENVPEAISILDENNCVIRVNSEFARLFGFSSDLAGQPIDQLIVPPDRHAEIAWIAENLNAGKKLALETRRRRRDGSLVDVLLSSSPVMLNGKTVGTCTSYRDITDQKRAEELSAVLYAIASRSQSAEDMGQFYAAIHNIVGQLMCARNFYIALYDPQSQLLSFPYFVDEKDEPPTPKRLGRGLTEYVLRTGEPLLATPEIFSELMGSGEVDLIGSRPLDWLGVPLKSGATSIGALVVQSYTQNVRFRERDREILQFVSQQLAVTIEHKRYEEALRRSEARYRSLIVSAVFGIYRCTLSGRFLDVNPALISMLGYGSVKEVLELDARRDVYVNPQEIERLTEEYRRAGCLNGVEVPWKHKDGRLIHVRLSGRAASGGEDQEEVLELIAEDVTERRQLEEQFRQAQKMEAVGRLAGGVAHDFNNLLMVINGYTEVLLEKMEAGSEMHQKVESIHQAADRAAVLTRQLLAFSRKQLLELKVVDLNAIIGNMERLLRPLIGENIELITRLSSETGHTRADVGQLEQVIMNLVVNAKDSMPEGGKIVIQSANVLVRPNTGEHRFIQPGHYSVISVADTGHGMDKETLSRIFEPFFTTKEKGKGTGLGLSTVYGIVKQSNGYVIAESNVGLGTTFYVYLPRVEESLEETPAMTREADKGGCETVLLVEDEESVRELVRLTLNSRGYKVLEAENGEAGLRLAEETKETIDILVTDVMMPGIGGRELAKKLVAMRPEICVLYLSGYTEDTVVTPGGLGPRAAFLQKPFTLQNLAKKVREVLRSKGLAKSASSYN